MILIYTHKTTARLNYVCKFIFKEILNTEYKITIDSNEFVQYNGTSINYSDEKIKENELIISPYTLLFEEDIKPQQIDCFDFNSAKAFFKTTTNGYDFDIFAATFYLLSRYEEYLPHTKDDYGRYYHQNSLAFKQNFLQLPLINIWINNFVKALNGNLQIANYNLLFNSTYDIDMAYAYKYKGLVRTIGGFLKQPSLQRLKVLFGLQKDPYDCYDWLHNLHAQYNVNATYFFLLAEKNSEFDKNILPIKNCMWQLIKQHAKKYAIGIHPSWQSGNAKSLLNKEIEWLKHMSDLLQIENSRQHYIRMNFPETYQYLIEAHITNDYSMGYGLVNGFRASTGNSFYWFNLEKNEETNLYIHPFCFMDANSFYEQKFSIAETKNELEHYKTVCKKYNTPLTTIWHNSFLSNQNEFAGWRNLYEEFVKGIKKHNNDLP